MSKTRRHQLNQSLPRSAVSTRKVSGAGRPKFRSFGANRASPASEFRTFGAKRAIRLRLYASRTRPDSGGHRDLLPLLALLDADPHVRLGCHRSQLPLQLSVTLKPPGIETAVSQRV